MSGLTRRDLIRSAAAMQMLGLLPGSALRAAALAGVPGAAETVLVVVQLSGGNDGLNTVVPWADDAYHRARPVLSVSPGSVLKLTDHVGLHPALAALQPVWEEGDLGVVQGVGYPDPNRSHFRSMEIWHTARTDDAPPTRGWLGEVAGGFGSGGALPTARVGARDLPLALAGAPSQVPAIGSLGDFVIESSGGLSASSERQLLSTACTRTEGRSGEAAFIAEAYAAAFDCARRLEEIGKSGTAGFPNGGMGRSLDLASQLIGARLGSRVLYVTQGGYDTHAGQNRSHPTLLRELGNSLAAFQEQLVRQGDADRVVTLVFSEFGRRIHENASGGTDHGAGNPVLLLGRPVAGGVTGHIPALDGAVDRDVPMSTDFRSVYVTLLDWLGAPAGRAVPGQFDRLPLLT
jgi:uncharacterized protein (DUF1501 family)